MREKKRGGERKRARGEQVIEMNCRKTGKSPFGGAVDCTSSRGEPLRVSNSLWNRMARLRVEASWASGGGEWKTFQKRQDGQAEDAVPAAVPATDVQHGIPPCYWVVGTGDSRELGLDMPG